VISVASAVKIHFCEGLSDVEARSRRETQKEEFDAT
jgi:hypothetical protein